MRRKTAIGIFCPVRRLISKAFFVLLLRLFLGEAVSQIEFNAIHSTQFFTRFKRYVLTNNMTMTFIVLPTF